MVREPDQAARFRGDVAVADFDDGAAVRAVTHPEIAAALSAATGRPVAFDDVTPAAFAEALGWFLPPWGLAGLVEDYAHYARGEAAVVDPAIEQVTGRPAIDITAFTRDHAGAFTAAGAA